VQEREFEAICTRLLNAKKHIVNAKDWLMNLKSDKPRVVSFDILCTFCRVQNKSFCYKYFVEWMLVFHFPGLNQNWSSNENTEKSYGSEKESQIDSQALKR